MYTIGKAAKRAGLSVDTLRYYESEGLLSSPRRTASNYRLYEETAIARLRFIKRAKALGFTLAEIRELLQLNDGGGERKSVRSVAQARAGEIARKIAELQRVHEMLEHLVSECDGHGDLAGCPIIEALLEDELNCASNWPSKRHHQG